MSRCFPYLRPNREAESVISLDEPLIETIKLPNEKESEKEKKERRKEKKREKKEKKERKKRSREDNLSLEPTEHRHKKRKNDEGKQFTQKEGCPTKAGEDASEQLEKSSVTEEVGLQSSTQSPYDSDRSQNTNQRVNPTAVVNPIHNNNGPIFRLRFSFGKKHKVQESLKLEDTEPNVSCEEPCFSGRRETAQGSEPAVERLHYLSSSQRNSSTDRSKTASRRDRAETADKPSSSHQRCSPTGRVGAIYKLDVTESAEKPSSSQQKCIETTGQQKATQDTDAPSTSNRKLNRSERKDQRYRDIVTNWNPQPFHCEFSDDNNEEGWLFESCVQKGDSVVKICDSGTEALGHVNTNTMVSLQPRACYMPDVDMYALPYVVPY